MLIHILIMTATGTSLLSSVRNYVFATVSSPFDPLRKAQRALNQLATGQYSYRINGQPDPEINEHNIKDLIDNFSSYFPSKEQKLDFLETHFEEILKISEFLINNSFISSAKSPDFKYYLFFILLGRLNLGFYIHKISWDEFSFGLKELQDNECNDFLSIDLLKYSHYLYLKIDDFLKIMENVYSNKELCHFFEFLFIENGIFKCIYFCDDMKYIYEKRDKIEILFTNNEITTVEFEQGSSVLKNFNYFQEISFFKGVTDILLSISSNKGINHLHKLFLHPFEYVKFVNNSLNACSHFLIKEISPKIQSMSVPLKSLKLFLPQAFIKSSLVELEVEVVYGDIEFLEEIFKSCLRKQLNFLKLVICDNCYVNILSRLSNILFDNAIDKKVIIKNDINPDDSLELLNLLSKIENLEELYLSINYVQKELFKKFKSITVETLELSFNEIIADYHKIDKFFWANTKNLRINFVNLTTNLILALHNSKLENLTLNCTKPGGYAVVNSTLDSSDFLKGLKSITFINCSITIDALDLLLSVNNPMEIFFDKCEFEDGLDIKNIALKEKQKVIICLNCKKETF